MSGIPSTITRPELASSQLSFTTADAVADLPDAPSYHYTIMVFLRCRSGANFSNVAYTEQVRHFIGVCKVGDPDFIILKKRQTARTNAITRQEEVPSNTLTFEEDFARDVVVDKQYSWVRFRVSVASSKRFGQLFRDDNFKTYPLVRKFRWHVDITTLDHDCYMVHIGWFKFLHPVFTNRDDLKRDFDVYFHHLIREYDFTSRYERRSFLSMKDDGSDKKDSCSIRVISMFVPVDIAYSASKAIVEYWGNELMEERGKQRDPTTPTNRLLLCEFIPNSTKLLPQEDQIQHLLDQGQFLNDFKDAVFIYDCITIDETFECSETIAQVSNAIKLQGQQTSLRKIMMSWVDNDTQEKIVKSIEQMAHSRFAIVAHHSVLPEVRKVIYAILESLRQELGDEKFKNLGGDVSDGMRVDDPKGLLQPQRARSYLNRLQHSSHYVKVGNKRYQQSAAQRQCVATNTNNTQIQRLYSDVLATSSHTSSKAVTSSSSSTTSLVLSKNDGSNQQLSSLEEFNSLVKQQVESIIAPSLAKLNSTITTVQQATSRVEQLEQRTTSVQKQQEETTQQMAQSMRDLTGMMQENLKMMRQESQSMQSSNNEQFKQLLQMLQQSSPHHTPSTISGHTVNTTPTKTSQISSLTNSAASQAASSNSTTLLTQSSLQQVSQSPSSKRKHDGTVLGTNDSDDAIMESINGTASFQDELCKQAAAQEELGSHKPKSLSSSQSLTRSKQRENEKGQRS